MPRFAALIVLDGFGCAGVAPPGDPSRQWNAIALARTPTFDRLYREHAWTLLGASGLAVGLPEGQMGNSEVGHLNIGCGRVVYQDSVRITKEIDDGVFSRNSVLHEAFRRARESGRAVHFMGLLSHGGVHSLQTHLYALLEMAEAEGVPAGYVHAILDGRDTPPKSAHENLAELAERLARHPRMRLASVVGRYYAMDRDQRWERTQRAYDLFTRGAGTPASDAVEAVGASHRTGKGDEFVEPIALTAGDGIHHGNIEDGDVVVFFNFRADRARQMTRAFTEKDFAGFARSAAPQVSFVTMTEYGDFDARIAFPPNRFENILAQVFETEGIANLRLAETEKYAHVTFFFNGGEHRQYGGEERRLVPSAKVATYDLEPAMSAAAITDEAIAAVRSSRFGAIIMNYANADMVGHTGFLEATKHGIETLDTCLSRLLPEIAAQGGVALITADHGNAEKMFDFESNQPHTAHTTNPVPLILVDPAYKGGLRSEGILADIASTLLGVMGVGVPKEISGRDLRDPLAPRTPRDACNE